MRVLIIGTTYEDNRERANLHDLWVKLHNTINPDCDFLIIDSASPYKPSIVERHPDIWLHRFWNNLGHLGHPNPQLRHDGWGRALCLGMQTAIDQQYDYVVHVEGDSLFRLDVLNICKELSRDGVQAASTYVYANRPNEIETGLMFFSVVYLQNSNFIARYNWPTRSLIPVTEEVIFNLTKPYMKIMPWKARRGEDGWITPHNVMMLDWITKCSDFRCYTKFTEELLRTSDQQ